MPTTTSSRVAIVYEPESIPLLALTAAARRNSVALVWVTHGADADLLRRFGTVLDVSGCSVDEVVAQLATADVTGVTTFADTQIERTAAITAALGVPGNPPWAARRLVDKVAQRQALCDAGVPVPGFVAVETGDLDDELRRRLDTLAYPVVIKPAFGFGGRDTLCLPDPAAVFAELVYRSRSGHLAPTIVEECLGVYPPAAPGGFGDYVSVELVVVDGHPHVVAVTGRMPLSEPFRETGAFLPCALAAADQHDVAAMAVAATRALDVQNACLHTEIKLTADGPRVIEVNGRVAGGGIADLVAKVSGVDLYSCALRTALGLPVDLPPAPPAAAVHYQLALQPPVGRHVRLAPDWATRLRRISEIDRVALRSVEAEVGIREGSYGYLLMASGEARDHPALLDTYRQLYDLLNAG